MPELQHAIHAIVRAGDEGGFVAECVEVAVVTQGATLDETITHLREAVSLHLEGEDLTKMGFAPDPVVLVSMEVHPVHA